VTGRGGKNEIKGGLHKRVIVGGGGGEEMPKMGILRKEEVSG